MQYGALVRYSRLQGNKVMTAVQGCNYKPYSAPGWLNCATSLHLTSRSQTAHRLRHSYLYLFQNTELPQNILRPAPVFIRPGSQSASAPRELSQNRLLPDSPSTTRLPVGAVEISGPAFEFL